jgi:hypothetical protein
MLERDRKLLEAQVKDLQVGLQRKYGTGFS